MPQAGENNFHAFYQLLKGAPKNQLDKLHLKNDLSLYRYLGGGGGKAQLPQKVTGDPWHRSVAKARLQLRLGVRLLHKLA